jgi:hypothetical protein
MEGIAEAHVRTRPDGGVESWSVAHVRFGIEHLATQPAWSRYRGIAHELVHVVQNAQQVRTGERAEHVMAPWIAEGTADALAADLTRSRGYGVEPPISVRGSRSLYGLRPWHRSLTWKSGSADRDRHGNLLITDYTASSFWTYLAERFFKGSFHYLVDWFAVPDPHEGRDDWLEWTDDLLRYDDGGIDHPLYLVFPDFIAHYASWGEKKYPSVGEQDWLHESFDRCEIVTVTPGAAPAELSLEVEPLSARCVKVMVGSVAPDEAVAVQFMAYDGDTDRLDNLHLVTARMANTVGGVTFECYDEARRMGPNALCLHKPFTGTRGRALAPSDMGGVTDSGGDFVKTWLGTQQVTGGEGLIENIYFLVHTPVEPRDAEHDVHQGGRHQTVRLHVGLERSNVTLAEDPSMASGSVNGSAGLGLVPMRGGDDPGGDPADLTGSITAAMESATDPEAMSRGLFLQNQPMGTVLPSSTLLPCDGVCMVTLQRTEPRPDGWGGHELVTTASVSLTPEDPIPWGTTGSFEAQVSTCPAEECDEGLGIGEGTITVAAFSEELLHLSVSGSYCVIRGFSGLGCPDPQTFEGEIVKPFGWAYDAGRTFNSIDTPGMAEYREYLTKSLAELLPGTVTVWRKQHDGLPGEDPVPAGEGGGDPAGGAGGAVTPTCDCSCDGYLRLMEAVEAYQAALQAAASAGEPPPPQPPAMSNLMRCSMQCAQQWGACGG